MELPIVAYGHPVLRQKCADIDGSYPDLFSLIENMWHTMYAANGCGLAAPQVNVPLKVFVVDSKNTYDILEEEDRDLLFDGDQGIRETFINAVIVDRSVDRTWEDEEGCLSIPDLSGNVERPWSIGICYLDIRFEPQMKIFHGLTARMIQHEYDHTEGILYLDYLKPKKKSALKNKLKRIAEGREKARYPMIFPDNNI